MTYGCFQALSAGFVPHRGIRALGFHGGMRIESQTEINYAPRVVNYLQKRGMDFCFLNQGVSEKFSRQRLDTAGCTPAVRAQH